MGLKKFLKKATAGRKSANDTGCSLDTTVSAIGSRKGKATKTSAEHHEIRTVLVVPTSDSGRGISNTTDSLTVSQSDGSAGQSHLVPPRPTSALSFSSAKSNLDISWNEEQWKKAYEIAKERLTVEERNQLPEYPSSNHGDSVLTIIEEAQQIRNDKKEAGLSYTNKEGERIYVVEKFDKIIRGLNEYARIVDVAVGHQPEVTSLVWASLRLILKVYLNRKDTIEAICQTMEKIASAMGAADCYARTYADMLKDDSESKLAATWNRSVSMALPEFYAAILVFTIKARTYFVGASKFQRGIASFKPFAVHFSEYITNINDKEKALERLANAATMKGVKELRHEFNTKLEAVNTIRDLFSEISVDKAMDWLNAIDSSPTYQFNKKMRLEGTCNWIFSNQDFQAWDAAEGSGHLWVLGIPGAGKSVLATSIIDYLESASDEVTVLYYFYRDGEEARMDPVEMAASLIAQLLRTATSDDDAMRMMRILRKELHDSSFFAQSQAQGGGRDYHRLCCMFLDMVSITQRKVKIVLDAMDECIQPDFVAEFVQLVDASVSALEEGDEDAASSQTPPIQFLLTGRPNVDHFYSSISTISTIRMDVDADIKKLVEEKVNKNTALQAHKDVIIDTIYKNSAGMFRYAALVLAELERYSPRPIEERLRTMPKGIFGIYELILTRLGADGDEHNREMRRRILMLCMVPNFCTFSSVDNAVSMLQHLCSIHPGEPSFDPSRAIPPTKEQLLSSCGSLVELRQSSTDDSSKCGKRKKSESEDVFEISFTHRTVREFLLRNRDDLSPEAAQNDFLFPLLTTVADSRLYICLCMLTGLLSIHSCPDSFYERASNSVYRNASGFLTGRGGLAVLAIENRERKSSDLSKFWELMARFIWDIRFVKHFTAFLFACRTENAFDGSAPRIRLMGPWMSMFKGMIRKEVLSIPPETLLGLYDLDEILKRYRPQLFSVTDWRLDLIDACEVRIRYDWDATKDCFTQPYMYPWTSVVIMHAVAIGRDAHDMAHELWDREDETYEVYSLLQISAFCESVHTGRLVMESYRALNDPSKAVHDAALSFLATIEPVVCAFEYFPDNIAAMLAEYPEILNSYEIVRFMKRTPLSLVVKLFNDLHNHKGNCFCCEDLSDSLTHFTPEPAEDPSAFDFFWSEKTGVMFDLKDPMRSFNSCDGRGGRVGDDDDDGFSAAVGLIRHGDSTYLQILYRKLRELGLKTLGEIGLFLPIDWEDIEEVEGELIYKHADAFASETQSLTSVDSFATANEDPVDEFYSSEEEDEPGKADGSEPDSSNEMYSSEEEDGMELEEGEKIGPDSSDEIHSSDGEDEMEEADEGEPTSVETIDFSAPEIPETELSGPA